MVSNMQVTVLSLNPDADPITGDPYTKIIFGIESKLPAPSPELVKTFLPLPKNMAWKNIIQLMIPNSKWQGQFQIWKVYELEIEESGELHLRPVNPEV